MLIEPELGDLRLNTLIFVDRKKSAYKWFKTTLKDGDKMVLAPVLHIR